MARFNPRVGIAIEDKTTGAIRFTTRGLQEYRAQFAKAGIDIRHIRTRAAFKEACQRSYPFWVEEMRQMVKGHKELEEILEPLWS